MQRGVEQADRDRVAGQGLEDPLEIRALHGEELGECAPAPGLIGCDDHFPHRRDAVAFKKHVLGAAETDPLGAELTRARRIHRGVRIGADA